MKPKTTPQIPDLQTQFETILHQVWRSEADWRLWDRVDAALMLEALRVKRLSCQDERKAA
jgi:hypothetical protein